MTSIFPPQLPAADVQHVVGKLVQRAYGGLNLAATDQKQIQNDLLEIQRRPEAWGLILPMLQSNDANVQFFGAHTAQIKVARDWNSVPEDHRTTIRDTVLRLSAHAAAHRQTRISIRKLFVAINAIAFKIAIGHPPIWENWIQSSVTFLAGAGTNTSDILEFLTIVAEEMVSADLLKSDRATLQQVMLDYVPHLAQAVATALSSPSDVTSALKCLQAWIVWGLPADTLLNFVPMLIQLLSNPTYFVQASDVLQEVLSTSVIADGGGSKVVTIPLLEWIAANGRQVFTASHGDDAQEDVALALCKLLVALGDHSTSYIADKLTQPIVQAYLDLILSFTSLPGHYGVDEEESEMTLNFWFRLQEEIWNADFSSSHWQPQDPQDELFESLGQPVSQPPAPDDEKSEDKWQFCLTLYRRLIEVLRRKVTWPPQEELSTWMKDQRQKFGVYRRDVGDTLINAFYILRDELLKLYVDDLVTNLAQITPTGPWESVEATLHCICSVHEAVPILDNSSLAKLFSTDVLGRLPNQGVHAVRTTALSLIGAYSSWFPNQDSALLMGCVSYIVGALHEPTLSLPAANALKDICDANRTRLTPHIGEFGTLYNNMNNIPDSEKPKVVQSIASVVEALQPQDAIAPVAAIVSPLVTKAFEALGLASQLPEEARQLCLHQLEAISRCAQGLTKNSDTMFILDEPDPKEMEAINTARADPRISSIHENLLKLIEATLSIWSGDALISDSISELLKSITALPADITILSLPPAPLLHIVVKTLQFSPNAIWLTQAGRLVLQLNPPVLYSPLKSVPNKEIYDQLTSILASIVTASFVSIGTPALMVENPDVVKAFFECLEVIAQDFVKVFFSIPEQLFTGVMSCAITALTLQERYSLVKSCAFLNTFVNQLLKDADLEAQASLVLLTYGKSLVHASVSGIAGAAPRSVLQNLVELLANVVAKRRADARPWMEEILYSDSFVGRDIAADAKRQFCEAVVGSRSTRKTRDAAQQFAIVARGLEGSSFGYATGTGTGGAL